MVHETTEYRRKFRWNSPQKRYQIWKENHNFREARRLWEFHHEPFPWEESDQSCRSSSTEDTENTYLPPSKLKQKHLDLIKLTGAAKQQTEHKAASVESIPPSPKPHSPFPERETYDVGVQTPNWEQLKDENKLLLQNEKSTEQELQEVSRRLKEEIAHSHGTLTLIEQIIQRGNENYSMKPSTIVEEKFQIPTSKKHEFANGASFHLKGKKNYSVRPSTAGEEKIQIPLSKKYATVLGNRSSSPDKRQRFFRSKSPFNLYGRQSKVCDALDKHTFAVKVTKNALQSSAPKIQRKNPSDNIHFSRQTNPKVERRSYKREGHRVINELWKHEEDAASKWLADYDNKCRFNVRSAPVHHTIY